MEAKSQSVLRITVESILCIVFRILQSILKSGTTLADLFGGLAQLGERLPCKQEVRGSTPLVSTMDQYDP